MTGDIVRIGSWVLREACRQSAMARVGPGHRAHRGECLLPPVPRDDLAEVVGDVLQEFSLPGSALELEFTERVLIEDAPDTIKAFADLRTLGVMLTIDDFGEGYSALNYLRRLPIHGLKLSQLFVHGVPEQIRCRGLPGRLRHRAQPGTGPGRRRRRVRCATPVPAAARRAGRPGFPVRTGPAARRIRATARPAFAPPEPDMHDARYDPIEPRDDARMASIIRTVMPEFGASGCGFAINDPEVDWMSRAYAQPRSAYFVVEARGVVLGGGGVAPLEGGDAATCELRKMYFLPQRADAAPARR